MVIAPPRWVAGRDGYRAFRDALKHRTKAGELRGNFGQKMRISANFVFRHPSGAWLRFVSVVLGCGCARCVVWVRTAAGGGDDRSEGAFDAGLA